nr:RAMP superfamily CRISPR-associated protein [uncultured Campylobacter sp.]
MKRYKITIKLLSPVHIGTGEDFEPMNYVMDTDTITTKDGKSIEGKFLYVFDEMDFFKSLSPSDKIEFTKIASLTTPDAVFKLHSFVRTRKEIAKDAKKAKILVDQKVYKDYQDKVGKVVQKEGLGINKANSYYQIPSKVSNQGPSKDVFAKFSIAKTFANPNSHKAIIPASSIKGAISTAYQEFLFKKLRDYSKVKEKMLSSDENNIFKNLLLSDSNEIKTTRIAYAKNIKRHNKKDGSEPKEGLNTRLQVISRANKDISITLNIKENEPNINDIKKACNEHFLPILFSHLDDEFAKKSIKDDFLDICSNLENNLKDNEFVLRIGKHSGARATTIDGMRKITILLGKNKGSEPAKEETTTWIVEGDQMPLGWVLCSYEELKD